MPDVPQEPADAQETVEQVVRAQLSKALGGPRGIVEGAVPTIVFTVVFLTTDELRPALIAGLSLAVLAVVVRLVQRSTVQFAVNALFGIGIAAAFALRAANAGGTPEDAARAFFTPGLIYNGVYAVVLVMTVVVGWPLVGFLVGSVMGDATQWHKNPALVRLCSRLTLVLALPCILRVAVQLPLWLDSQIGLLGVTKIALGWPLQVGAFALMIWMLSRNKTPQLS
ncbi:DUF3159 domain-containing protein [Aeromicrobium sp. CF3.5]|uniref:DUF3159 domain-containing protein n=1 Tax=Aeromicrobium sp. CF3.5 TaxID=3373078 RepID=UPI003EE798C4